MTEQSLIIRSKYIATMDSALSTAYGAISDGAIAIKDGKIIWIGQSHDMPRDYQDFASHDYGDSLITPSLIDCHTHVIAGGNRAKEFEMRLEGASYEDIARAGGGINSTVRATRAASEDELLKDALSRIDAMIAEGVSCIEIKSGYGLDHNNELKMLRVAKRIGQLRPIHVTTTFLGAHATPPEFKDKADTYIDDVCIPTLRAAHEQELVDCVDGFCENIAFTPDQIARVFRVAQELGLPIKLHAEQLTNSGGAKLAASFGALSADHIEYLDQKGVEAMAKAGTCAVLLPGAFYTLKETQIPPVNLLREYNIPTAIATDCNPGSSPMTSLLLTMNMACTLFGLTPHEALVGATRNAAKALGKTDIGTLKIGNHADLAIWNLKHPAELSYSIGFNALNTRLFGGKFV